MSDSEDFIDDNAPQDSFDVLEVPQPRPKTGKRGKDIPWLAVRTFASNADYDESDIAKEIKDDFSARAMRESEHADTIRYSCKFSRKVGWKVCPKMYRVKYMAHCEEVTVEQYGDVHLHEEEEEHERQGVNFRWTTAMTECIMTSVRNEATPAVVLRNLKDLNLLPKNNAPTAQQLNNKISYCRKLLLKTDQIFTTGDLRAKASQQLDVPEDECEPYIAHYTIDDEHEDKEPRFAIIWTSKKLLNRIKGDLTQDDATYR